MDIQIIIGTNKAKTAEGLEQFLIQNGYRVLAICSDGQDILRRLASQEVDLLILEPTLKGLSMKEVVSIALEMYTIPVVMLTNDSEQNYFYELEGHFAFTCIQKPLSKQILLQSIVLLLNSVAVVKRLQAKVEQLTEKLQETDILYQAKQYLIKTQGMSEPEAHRYIQVESMKKKCSKEKIAGDILKNPN